MESAIVVGSKTDHGGTILIGENKFKVDGKSVHLEGMSHFCPKCKVVSTAISAGHAPNVLGRKIIIAGDRASCGAIFVESNQYFLKVERLNLKFNPLLKNAINSNLVNKEPLFDEQFILKTDEDEILSNMPYTIKFSDGVYKKGISDENGLTERVSTKNVETLEVYIGHI